MFNPVHYIKSVSANNATVVGYAAFAAGIIGKYNEIGFISLTDFAIATGIAMISITSAGADTYVAYSRTKKHIERFNTIDSRFLKQFKNEYCIQQGIIAAAKEHGIEYLVQQHSAQFQK